MFKGWFGEQKTSLNLWFTLDRKKYQRFSNIIIPSRNGTSQLDHIVLSPFGLFIIETKNRKGWIFGSFDQPKWTQVIFERRYSFQNPLRQTYRQKKVLSEFLNLNESLIQTVVFFNGDSEFMTDLPPNVLSYGLSDYISQFNEEVIDKNEQKRISNLLKKLKKENRFSNEEHLQSLDERYSSNTICPKCGSDLVLREVKNGPNKGSQFLGCDSYPKCRFTKDNEIIDDGYDPIKILVLVGILIILFYLLY